MTTAQKFARIRVGHCVRNSEPAICAGFLFYRDMKKLTQEQVKHLFDYDPETGLLTRKVRVGGSTQIGQIVGSKNGCGHLAVKIDYVSHQVHRIIFLWMTGRLPGADIDHINGVKTDNRWSNLRAVSRSENLRNQKRRSTNKSGFTGVSRAREGGTWRATIWDGSAQRHLGSYKTRKEAASAWAKAKQELGYHENHGRVV